MSVFALLFLGSLVAADTDWSTVLPNVLKAVPRIEAIAEGEERPSICSGAVINATAGYVVTAEHCIRGEDVSLTVNGRHAEVVRSNRVLDLAVIRFSVKGETALRVAREPPQMGQEISVIGYAFGSKQLSSQVGHVTNPLEEADNVMRVAVDVIMGDSGGPCINTAGELVGITTAVQYYGPMHLGIIVPLASVQDFVSQYLPREAKP